MAEIDFSISDSAQAKWAWFDSMKKDAPLFGRVSAGDFETIWEAAWAAAKAHETTIQEEGGEG